MTNSMVVGCSVTNFLSPGMDGKQIEANPME
jgi:hypothetical protein